ncbi:hypothetical protein AB1Y20_019597 [Prymnesium parvum]|uniref:Uncharacterized protein n=1 Tax=Prymnesium parvum TaxID=97485 RepID=A0AB34JUJ6_PRYPA
MGGVCDDSDSTVSADAATCSHCTQPSLGGAMPSAPLVGTAPSCSAAAWGEGASATSSRGCGRSPAGRDETSRR